ncbi:hypothetical protein A2W70_05760 [Candidatus Curtissbacteria bacterium RIFCSPLOWO2_02_41_11]|uniref:Transposase IS200-like domain-containing protein n=2 Tax=Candidatus Curtissiibacteriota TaxID=1752717 RepID=A0A1F5HP82_9BACT|nr:MAG: hypothetical protein UU56_C0002G0101 [Candidatus Curtissbacteria bacterium GW2011_GWA2_41_24]OGE05978.1 MAG: hypothetical protein A2W70_05760 [Candidatus Curtissbacteria bacterium RIFCSPLOWO2_02_41_11]
MPYRGPIFFAGGYYHVYSRGSEKRTIFLDKADKKRFTSKLKEYKTLHNVSVISYCLMPNHFHLLIKQNTDEPISKFINRLNLAYAMYFNKRYERVGPLFQGRFKAINVDNDEYLLHLTRYIHLNPLEVLGGNRLEDYWWSSLRIYLGMTDDDIVDTDFVSSYFGENWNNKYREFLKGEEKKRLRDLIAKYLFEDTPSQVRVLNWGEKRA